MHWRVLARIRSGDSDGETAATTRNDRRDAFRKTEKAGEGYALERNSADGLKGNASTIWNPSRDQWIVIWVCSLTAWLLWSSDNGRSWLYQFIWTQHRSTHWHSCDCYGRASDLAARVSPQEVSTVN